MTARSARIGLIGSAFGALIASIGAAGGQSVPASQRAVLDRYCVTCHNDRLKTANLSLQDRDLTRVADQADVWEKVIRKLRAGAMPPPDVPRPPLAEYEGVRDFLEGEIDRAAAG